MEIYVFGKNGALEYEISNAQGPVPRVGETIYLGQPYNKVDGMTDMLVHDVTYILSGESLVASVSCHACNGPENRNITLREHGWLDTLFEK